MKKGINAWCIPAETPVAEAFALCKKYGFHGIELNMTEEAPEGDRVGNVLSLSTTETEWAKIADYSKEYGILLPSLSSGLFWKYPLTSPDSDIREKSKEIIKTMIDAAAYLGCGVILVVPGLVTPAVSYRDAYDRAITSLKEVAPYAEKKGIIIGIENVWNKFLLSPLEMAAFIDEVGSPFVKSYLDVGNVLQFSFPQHWITALGNRIAAVHVKDFDTKIGNITGFTRLMKGSMPWQETVQALKSIGYDGFLTAELGAADPHQLMAETSDALDKIIAMKE